MKDTSQVTSKRGDNRLAMKNIGEAIWDGLAFGVGGSVIGTLIGCLGAFGSFGVFASWEELSGYIKNGAFLGFAAGAVIGLIYGIIKSSRDEAERLRALEAAESQRLQRHKEGQQGLREQMLAQGEHSIKLFELMPKHLDSAEKWLDRAEADFAEGAFVPFWDSIETAAKMLARFNEGVRQIDDHSSCYINLIGDYEATPPQFPLTRKSVEKLSVGTVTAERMNAIVRAAQCNFQFAHIYGQRKTNQILIKGFTNLAQALEEMTWQITSSIDGLADSVHVMTSTLDESLRAIHSTADDIAEMTERHHGELMEKASQTAERERTALEMLDNIQRGRRPP